MVAEFIPFSQVRTRNKKEKTIEITIHPTLQCDHPNSMVEVVSDSPLFTLASVSAKLFKDSTLEITSPSAQGMGPEEKITSINLETPSRKLSSNFSSLWETNILASCTIDIN